MDSNRNIRVDILEDVRYKQILSNIKQRAYQIIGMGSGRTVFDLGDGTVAKFARNVRGTVQNEAEYKIYINSAPDNSDLFAKILGASEKFDLLIMEKADRIRNISYVWNYFNVRGSSLLYRLKKIQELSVRYDLDLVDFLRASSWGRVDGRPVIIDYGLTREIQRKYYRRK